MQNMICYFFLSSCSKQIGYYIKKIERGINFIQDILSMKYPGKKNMLKTPDAITHPTLTNKNIKASWMLSCGHTPCWVDSMHISIKRQFVSAWPPFFNNPSWVWLSHRRFSEKCLAVKLLPWNRAWIFMINHEFANKNYSNWRTVCTWRTKPQKAKTNCRWFIRW